MYLATLWSIQEGGGGRGGGGGGGVGAGGTFLPDLYLGGAQGDTSYKFKD